MHDTWAALRADTSGWDDGLYGKNARGQHEMANAFLNAVRSGGFRGKPEAMWQYQARTGKGNAERGWWGRPRVPQRCEWPLGPCAPGCTGKHVDGDALDAERRAA